jgi:DNA-binding MarR family transcriptional regulator
VSRKSQLSKEKVELIRRFNRFYTKHVGILRRNFLGTPFSLAEGRVLFEIAQHSNPIPTEIAVLLGLDLGYLSRMLHDFVKSGYVTKARSSDDGRVARLALTRRGVRALAQLDRRQRKVINMMLAGLSSTQQRSLISAMREIQNLLEKPLVTGRSRLVAGSGKQRAGNAPKI